MPEFDVAGGQRPEEERTLLNRFFDTLKWMSPIVNLGRLGQVEPPAAFLRDGLIAYADGTNWNPGWGKGYYRYSTDSPAHWETIVPHELYKSYHMRSEAGASGTYYGAGYYTFSAADANLDEGSLTVTHGSVNISYAAHAFLVAAAAGATNTGTVSIVVSGTSITDAGARQTSDTEIIVADVTDMSTNKYYETTKKWIGQITYTLTGAGGAGTFNADFNYGFTKYDDLGNHSFHINTFECVGFGGANDAGFDIELLHHKSTGWTYHATAFVPDPPVITQLTTTHVTETEMANNDCIAFKRTGLHHAIEGNDSEGFIIRITTTANNAVEFMDMHVGYH